MSEALPFAKSYRELLAYQKAKDLAHKIFIISKTFPKEETYSLTSQIRRSSRSIGAQIAEAWAKKRYIKHFVSKLTDADGEQLETQHWIYIAVDSGYLDRSAGEILYKDCLEVGRLIGSMINKPEVFCKGSEKAIRETQEQYFTNPQGEYLELSNPDQEESIVF